MREAGDEVERRHDLEEGEDYGDDEDILDLRMPKGSGPKGGGGGKAKKRNQGRRARNKTRFRQPWDRENFWLERNKKYFSNTLVVHGHCLWLQ